MRINFKQLQKQYPDAIKAQLTLKNPFQPIAIHHLVKAWGTILHNRLNPAGKIQTFISSKSILPIPITVIYGPAASGKSTMASEIATRHGKWQSIRYTNLEPSMKGLSSAHVMNGIKVVVIDEAPVTCLFTRLRIPFEDYSGIVVPERIIVLVQGTPVFMESDDAIEFISTQKEVANG